MANLNLEKYFSKYVVDPYTDPKNIINYTPIQADVKDDQGNLVERIDAIFPSFWSQNSINTTTSKYFRREGVPGTGKEKDLRQLLKRVSEKMAKWGVEQDYFDEDFSKDFAYEIASAVLFQQGSFNSPVWFNLGLDSYGIKGGDDVIYHIENNIPVETKNNHENPIVSACFIVSPKDSIESMIDTGAVISSRIFKGGSGIGGDWSEVRSAGEPVSGGGVASGAVRFMDLQDSCGRVIKSGGKTRRAATMQSISVWHPDLEEIIRHKYVSEQKAKVQIDAGSPRNWESHTIQDLRGQNVNISVRIPDEFWEAYEKDGKYSIKRVIDGKTKEEVHARKLARIIAFANYSCGDPGIQNHSIINKYNTCKNSGEIWASNPCSEYMFLNNSACNLASINLMRFRKESGEFDIDSFRKAVDLFITAQDILVSKASYPTKEITENSHKFRPLGLGYANLGAYIMSLGLPYDSEEARNFASAITSLMTAEAYLQSTVLAEELGTFSEYEKNKEPMLEVIGLHKNSTKLIPKKNGLEKIINTALKVWEEVEDRGKKYGFRNAQVTLLAPTGTIGLKMGCDTTGGEPAFSLIAYKELAGGGIMNIVNQTVPLALEHLGYDKETIQNIKDYIDDKKTIEGCDLLKPEHLGVFDCATTSGEGTRFIDPMGHIRMIGAIQPFLSGAISKTINCPESTTIEEIEEMFYQGWKLGAKAVTIYRDGSKVAQPMTTKKKESNITILERGKREPLPLMREGVTQKIKIGDISVFIRTGEYKDGRLGELFVDSLERGSEVNRLLNENAVQFSEKLQYGVPLIEAIEIFSKSGSSQIAGLIDHPFIKTARGIEGFLFDWLRAEYLGDISFVSKDDPEMRPLPEELRIYRNVPPLHMIPTVEGIKFYPGVPSLEETIMKISGENYWKDLGIDTRKTIEKIKRNRVWGKENFEDGNKGSKLTGSTCNKCGNLMISDGSCWKCPICKTSTGGCGGG